MRTQQYTVPPWHSHSKQTLRGVKPRTSTIKTMDIYGQTFGITTHGVRFNIALFGFILELQLLPFKLPAPCVVVLGAPVRVVVLVNLPLHLSLLVVPALNLFRQLMPLYGINGWCWCGLTSIGC